MADIDLCTGVNLISLNGGLSSHRAWDNEAVNGVVAGSSLSYSKRNHCSRNMVVVRIAGQVFGITNHPTIGDLDLTLQTRSSSSLKENSTGEQMQSRKGMKSPLRTKEDIWLMNGKRSSESGKAARLCQLLGSTWSERCCLGTLLISEPYLEAQTSSQKTFSLHPQPPLPSSPTWDGKLNPIAPHSRTLARQTGWAALTVSAASSVIEL